MRRPEILTSAVLAVAGLTLALWLAANRIPPTPEPPVVPAAASDLPLLVTPPMRSPPGGGLDVALPDVAFGHNGLPCGPLLSVVPAAAGLASLVVNAPCRTGEIVEVIHGPVRFAARLSDRGTFRVALPVVDSSAGYSAEFDEARISAEPIGAVEMRVLSGVQWFSPLDLSLAAYEFGALDALRADAPGGSGQVLRFGEAGLGAMTEIYVGPGAAGPGVVRLHVEARPGPESCDALLPLKAFHAAGAAPVVRDIRLRLGGCDGLERPVLLKNLVEDLKIALR